MKRLENGQLPNGTKVDKQNPLMSPTSQQSMGEVKESILIKNKNSSRAQAENVMSSISQNYDSDNEGSKKGLDLNKQPNKQTDPEGSDFGSP